MNVDLGDRGGRLEFRVLGPLEVLIDGRRVLLGGAKQRSVLALLLVRVNRVVSVDELVEALWDGRPPSSAVTRVADYVSLLRRAFDEVGGTGMGRDVIVTRPPGYLLRAASGRLDVEVFERSAEEARGALAEGRVEEAAGRLEASLRLWRGVPFGDLTGAVIEMEAARLEERRLTVVEERIEAGLVLGRHADLVAELAGLVAGHPLRERLRGQQMVALYRSGRQAEALATFEDARRYLSDELGIDPGPQLRNLQARVLAADPALDASVQVPVAGGMGAQRQLPMDIAEFTGRVEQLRRLRQVIQMAGSGPDGGPGMGTAVVIFAIEGMAGVGKTRLAVHAAHLLVGGGAFAEVQLWTDLRGFARDQRPAQPATVLEAFLRQLGVPGGQIPPELEARAALYRDRLAGKRALVLLDNAADEEQVRPLLPGSPTCLVLITSRRSLPGLDGTHPLRLDTFSPMDATTLLGRIAGPERVAAHPQAGNQIAELCGYLPLALALAARRLQTRPAWSLADLAAQLEAGEQRLGRLTAGRRAVGAAFDLSYEALPSEQQRMFRLLALHPGEDIAADAAAALANIAPDRAETLLEALLDEYLLQQSTPGRYRFHDLLRLYAHQRVTSEEDEATQIAALQRLVRWYLATTQTTHHHIETRWPLLTFTDSPLVTPSGTGQSGPRLDLATREDALAWLESERPNLLALSNEAAHRNWHLLAWQLAAAVHPFLYLRQYTRDRFRNLLLALSEARNGHDLPAEAQALINLGLLHHDLGRYPRAEQHHRQALTICGQTGDRVAEAWALHGLGIVYTRLGQYPRAEQHLQQALTVCEQTGDQYAQAWALFGLGLVYSDLGQYLRAEQHHREALTVCEQTGDQYAEAWALFGLGLVYSDLGQYLRAEQHHREALSVCEQTGDRHPEAWALFGLGLVYSRLGEYPRAEQHHRQALTICEQIGDRYGEAHALFSLGKLHHAENRIDCAVDCIIRAAQIWQNLQLPLLHARALRRLGDIHAHTGNTDEAHDAWQQAQALQEQASKVKAD